MDSQRRCKGEDLLSENVRDRLLQLMKLALLPIVFGLLLVNCGQDTSTLAQQKICAEAAQRFENKHCVLNPCFITNHYNKKFDKCFVKVRLNFGFTDSEKFKHHPRDERLYNVFESEKPIGAYVNRPVDGSTWACYVGQVTCRSGDEFDVLIKPYMEE